MSRYGGPDTDGNRRRRRRKKRKRRGGGGDRLKGEVKVECHGRHC